MDTREHNRRDFESVKSVPRWPRISSMISCGILRTTGTTTSLVGRFALEVFEPIGIVGGGRLEQSSALFLCRLVICNVGFGHVWPLGARNGRAADNETEWLELEF